MSDDFHVHSCPTCMKGHKCTNIGCANWGYLECPSCYEIRKEGGTAHSEVRVSARLKRKAAKVQ